MSTTVNEELLADTLAWAHGDDLYRIAGHFTDGRIEMPGDVQQAYDDGAVGSYWDGCDEDEVPW